jgi:glycosyltransferase involved in cell wall biosynthesis
LPLIVGMGEGPLVSVVIPTWNRRQLVQEAIASVLAQTYINFELIVVDDGSTDRTVEELRRLDDPRLHVIAAEHTGSAAISRNVGIKEAKGEWIAFLDSDDLWMPDKLELQLNAVTSTGAAWCYGDYTLMDEHGSDIPLRAGGFRALSGWIIEDLLLDRTAVSPDCLLITRDVLAKIGGFDPALHRREDLDFDFRLAIAGEAVALPRVLARVRDHASRKTAGGFAHESTVEVYRNFISRRPGRKFERMARKMLARHLADAAADRIAAGHLLEAARLLTESLFLGDAPSHWLRAGARGVGRRLK